MACAPSSKTGWLRWRACLRFLPLILLVGCDLLSIKAMIPCEEPRYRDAEPWYRDADGDGFGDPETRRKRPGSTGAWVRDNTDCDDDSLYVYPGAPQLCDGIANDCDVEVDDVEGTVSLAVEGDTVESWTVLDWTAPSQTLGQAGTVWVCSDEYTVNLVITAAGVTVRGRKVEGIDDDIILDGGQTGLSVVDVQVADVTLQDLTIRNGKEVENGGGLYADGADRLTLERVNVIENQAATGGGLYIMNSSDVALRNVIVSGNTATAGGGLAVERSTVTLTCEDDECDADDNQTAVEDNVADSGAGIWMTGDDSVVNLYAGVAVIQNNGDGAQPGSQGGAAYINDGTLNCDYAEVGNNQAAEGGGAYLVDGIVEVTACVWNGPVQFESGQTYDPTTGTVTFRCEADDCS